MRVRELIVQLNQLPPNAKVLIYEDQALKGAVEVDGVEYYEKENEVYLEGS